VSVILETTTSRGLGLHSSSPSYYCTQQNEHSCFHKMHVANSANVIAFLPYAYRTRRLRHSLCKLNYVHNQINV